MRVFCHVPKTAGTAFRESLSPEVRIVSSYPRTTAQQTSPVRDVPAGTELVMGHFWAGLYRGGHVMLLRDPVERAVSNFFHFVQSAERGIGTNLLMEAVGRGVVSLDDWALGRGPGDEIWPGYPEERPWNMMGRWIAGIPDPERWRDGSLWAEVVSGLGRFDAIATDPQKLFEFMGFEGEVRRVNANPGNPGPGVLSRAARSELVVRNMVDYRLFDMVNEAGGLLCSPF